MTTRVILGEPELILREGLKALLPNDEFEVVGEASDGPAIVDLARKLRPQIAILEISLPLLTGIDAARAISAIDVGTKPVLLTRNVDTHTVLEAFRSGVRGYVTKTQGIRDLIEALREVTRGRRYISFAVSHSVVDRLLSPPVAQGRPLTARERQIVQLVAEGNTTKDIALLLHLSSKTIESHRRRVMAKLNLVSTPSLVRYAVRHGLVHP